MYPLIARHPVVGLSDAPPQPLAKAQAVSERQLMCQRQAVKFSHVIHIRSEGGVWGGGGGVVRGGMEGGMEGGREGGITKAGLMHVAVIKPASTNASQVQGTGLRGHTLHACGGVKINRGLTAEGQSASSYRGLVLF